MLVECVHQRTPVFACYAASSGFASTKGLMNKICLKEKAKTVRSSPKKLKAKTGRRRTGPNQIKYLRLLRSGVYPEPVEGSGFASTKGLINKICLKEKAKTVRSRRRRRRTKSNNMFHL